jgi:hypothetical protein
MTSPCGDVHAALIELAHCAEGVAATYGRNGPVPPAKAVGDLLISTAAVLGAIGDEFLESATDCHP